MQKFSILLIVSLLFCMAEAPAPDAALHFPKSGFSIKPLEASAPSDAVYQCVSLFLPVQDGIAPNVNVQIQPFADTIDTFMLISNQQFAQLKFKLLQNKKIDSSTAVFEYTGSISGKEFHWYSKAVKEGDKVYLAAAIGTPKSWPKISAQLISCVDSLQLDPQ
jgi:hypothetical protein